MNSNELKSKFGETYEKFFFENPIVISMPFVMTWSGDYSAEFSGINIKQKIPLRMYVGIRPTGEKGVRLWKLAYYNFAEGKFLTEELTSYSEHFKGIAKILEEKYRNDSEGGMLLNFLSELPWTIGLGFEAIMGTLLITGIERFRNRIDSEKIVDMQDDRLDVIWSKYHEILSPLFVTSYGYLIHSYKSFPITGDISTSFYKGAYPFVTLSISQSFSGDYDKIIYKGGWAQVFRIDELMDDDEAFPHLPLDYGIVYSGQPIVTQQILNATSHALDWVEKTKRKLRDIFRDFLKVKGSGTSNHYDHLLDVNNHEFEKTYSNLMLVVSFEIFNLMVRLYRKWYSEENIAMFLLSLNKLRYSNYVRNFSQGFFHFINEMERQVNLPNVLALLPNDTTVMGGTVIFTLPLERYRVNMRTGIHETQKTYPGAYTVYENWIDGTEEVGIIFEQDIQNGIYSQYSKKKSFLFRWHTGLLKMIDGKDFLDIKNTEEIILDKIRNKILICGEYVDSKDLSSQSGSIDIITRVLDGQGKEIHSGEMVVSSYSKNRNEMLSKVINPFVKLVSERLGKEVTVLCTGTISDFYLKIDLSDLRIGILEKIG